MRKRKVISADKTKDELIELYQKDWRMAWMYGIGAIIGSLILGIFMELLLTKLRTDYAIIMTSPIWNGICWVVIGLSIMDIICAILTIRQIIRAHKILRHLYDMAP